jgi:hypothetical protein
MWFASRLALSGRLAGLRGQAATERLPHLNQQLLGEPDHSRAQEAVNAP